MPVSRNRIQRMAFSLVIVLMLGTLLAGCGGQQAEVLRFPDFTLFDLDGNPVTQEIFARRDLTVVNVWGTYCPPCIKEMPDLLALREAVDPEKLVIVGISLDYDPKTLDRYLEKKPLNFPTYIADPDLMQLLQIRSIPMMRLYDKDGMEVMRQEGYVPLEELRPTIDNLLPKDE